MTSSAVLPNPLLRQWYLCRFAIANNRIFLLLLWPITAIVSGGSPLVGLILAVAFPLLFASRLFYCEDSAGLRFLLSLPVAPRETVAARYSATLLFLLSMLAAWLIGALAVRPLMPASILDATDLFVLPPAQLVSLVLLLSGAVLLLSSVQIPIAVRFPFRLSNVISILFYFAAYFIPMRLLDYQSPDFLVSSARLLTPAAALPAFLVTLAVFFCSYLLSVQLFKKREK